MARRAEARAAPPSAAQKRVLTALVAAPIVLAAVFWLPDPLFLALVVAVLEAAVVEYVRICRAWVPEAPLAALLVLMPLVVVAMAASSSAIAAGGPPGLEPVLAAAYVSLLLGGLVLWSRTPMSQALPATGILAFGTAYFALPAVSLWRIQAADPWLVLLLLLVVWSNDTAAYYFGSRFGRRKLAPLVSPNKSWEGAVAGLVAGLVVAAAWGLLRGGAVPPKLLIAGAVTATAAQVGDLVESMIKRGAGVKDSGHLVPGHGGVLDRVDALLFAAPAFLLALHWLGLGAALW